MKHSLLLRNAIIVICLLASNGAFSQTWYSQSNPTWSCNQLGTCPTWTLGSCPNKSPGGCTISCIAMMTNGAYNPGTLNTWLKANGGYSGCNVIFSKTPSGLTYLSASAALNDYNTLYTNITSCKKAIVNVTLGAQPYDHWVLVYAFTGTASNQNNPAYYSVYDPWLTTYAPRTLASYTGFKNAKYYAMQSTFSNSPAPASISGVCTAPTTEVVNWSAVTGATGYEVSIKKSSSSTWSVYTTTGTSQTFTLLSLNTTYNVRVRPFQCTVYGNNYATFNFTTAKSAKKGLTSIDNTEISTDIKIYPNPVKSASQITITDFGDISEKVTLTVKAMNGQVVSTQVVDPLQVSEIKITAPEIPGLYVIQLTAADSYIDIRKLIVY